MPEFIEKLKPFLKEDVKVEDVSTLLTAYSEKLKQGIDPLTGITTENAWDMVNKHAPLKSIFDKKVTESIETYKTNNFDKMYQERYNKEHPPEDEKDQKLRALEAKINETNNLLEEQKKVAERERIRGIATKRAIELLGQEAVKIVDLIDADNEENVESKLKILVEFVSGAKNSATEELMKNYSTNPGTGGGTPQTIRENLIKKYNEAEERYKQSNNMQDYMILETIGAKLRKLKK